MQDRVKESSPLSLDSGKEAFLMSAILSSGGSSSSPGSRIVKRRRSEDSGGSSSEPRSLSPMDLTSSKTPISTSPQEEEEEVEEQSIKRRRLDELLSQKFPSSSMSSNQGSASTLPSQNEEATPLSSRSKRCRNEPDPMGYEEDPSVRAGRFIQIAALLNSDVFKRNPLLYYGYYAQLLQNMQRGANIHQNQTAHNNINNNNTNMNNNLHLHSGDRKAIHRPNSAFKGYTSPEASQRIGKRSFHLSSLLSTPSSTSSGGSSPAAQRPLDTSPPFPAANDLPGSPGSSPEEEARSGHKRAPRALTGRYVRPGTGASPRTLALLRKKVTERLRLKGENAEATTPILHPRKHNNKKAA